MACSKPGAFRYLSMKGSELPVPGGMQAEKAPLVEGSREKPGPVSHTIPHAVLLRC